MNILCGIAISVGSLVSAWAGEKSDFYVLAGQSNMMGTGVLKQAPANYRKAVEGIFVWNDKRSLCLLFLLQNLDLSCHS